LGVVSWLARFPCPPANAKLDGAWRGSLPGSTNAGKNEMLATKANFEGVRFLPSTPLAGRCYWKWEWELGEY